MFLTFFLTFVKKFGLLLVVLLLLRTTGLTHHPVVNDEALYVEYMQKIQTDFHEYKWISIDNIHNDWKPPMQYWLGSLFIGIGENPMIGPRLMNGLSTWLGYCVLLFLLWYITKKPSIVVLTGIFFAISPTFSNLDKLVLTDGLIYGWGMILMGLVFWRTKLLQKRGLSLIIMTSILIILGICVLMLTKQTGEVYALYPVLMILLALFHDEENTEESIGNIGNISKISKISKKNIFLFVGYCVLYVCLYLLARVCYLEIIPDTLYAGKDAFSGMTGYVYSIGELLSFPFSAWLTNIHQAITLHYKVALGYGTLISIAVSILFSFIVTKDWKGHLFFFLSYVRVGGFYIIIVKNFEIQGNKFMLYTLYVVLVWRAYALGSVITLVAQKKQSLVAIITMIISFIIVPHWYYNLSFYTIQSHDAREVIGTYTGKCIKDKSCNRGMHAQTHELIDYFVQREKQGLSSIVLVDPTRGMPGTVVTIHQDLFPHQYIIGHITPAIADTSEYVIETLKKKTDKDIIFVFDGLSPKYGQGYENPDWLRDFDCPEDLVLDKYGMEETNFTICKRGK